MRLHYIRRVFPVVILGIFLSVQAYAKPGRFFRGEVSQPDGTSFVMIRYGDEFNKVRKTQDGCAVTLDADGWWCYAVLDNRGRSVSSGCHVGESAPAYIIEESRYACANSVSAGRLSADRLFSSEMPIMKRIAAANLTTKASDVTVVKHGIVLLAAFKDVKFKYTRADFEDMLTRSGYSKNGATGCAKEYFEQQFGRGYEFVFDVRGVYTMSHNRSWYGANDDSGSDVAPEKMIAEACTLAAADGVDFSPYDQDNDGEVDNVFVFFAGEDEADYNDEEHEDLIWSHAWYIKSGAGIDLKLNGKVINRYACASELSPSGKSVVMTGIGTFCHEYSHTLGLPDLYDTDYEKSGGMSAALWSYTALMDGGNSNNNGNTPPYFNALDREILGISEPVVISSNGTYTLSPIGEGGDVYRLDTDSPDEYFLFECRAANGWDKYAGGSGMLVYHVDKSRTTGIKSDTYKSLTPFQRWNDFNEVNANPAHQCADLLEAELWKDSYSNFESFRSFLRSKNNSASGVFFPRSGITSLGVGSAHGLAFWSGGASHISISDIRREGDNVSFYVSGFEGVLPVASISDYSVFQDAAIVSFACSSAEADLPATVVWGRTDSQEQKTVQVLPYDKGKYSVTLEGLTPSTSYNVSVYFKTGEGTGKPASVGLTTSRYREGSYPYISFKSVDRNEDGTFTAASRLPLRVANAVGAVNVKWYYDGKEISAGPDGYFVPKKDGQLKAEVMWENGSRDVIVKKIRIKDEK